MKFNSIKLFMFLVIFGFKSNLILYSPTKMSFIHCSVDQIIAVANKTIKNGFNAWNIPAETPSINCTFLSVNSVIEEAACSNKAQKNTENAIKTKIEKVWLRSTRLHWVNRK